MRNIIKLIFLSGEKEVMSQTFVRKETADKLHACFLSNKFNHFKIRFS